MFVMARRSGSPGVVKNMTETGSIIGTKRIRSSITADREQNNITVSVADVPEYLRVGQLYCSFNVEDNEPLSVPTGLLKPDPSVASVEDLFLFLNTLRYWIVDKIFPEVVDFILSEEDLVRLVNFPGHNSSQKLCAAVMFHNLDCLKCFTDDQLSFMAVKFNPLPALRFLHEHGTPLNHFLCDIAAAEGHVECLKFLYEAGCEGNQVATLRAARADHLQILKYLHEQHCPWEHVACDAAAEGGHMACLVFLHERGCPWDADTISCAAKGGSLPCLQYLHEAQCEWDESTCSAAARGGHLACMQYAFENGCDWNEPTLVDAAIGGNLECLKLLHAAGCAGTADACFTAARFGHLPVLQYLYAHESGCRWDYTTIKAVEGTKMVECLQYAREHKCPEKR